MPDIFDTITKGMVDSGIFTENATGAHLRAMLPPEAVREIESQMSAESADPINKEIGSMPIDLEALDLPAEVVSYISELEGKTVAASAAEQNEEPDDDDEQLEDEAGGEPPDIPTLLKSLDPQIAAIFKEQQDRVAAAETALAKIEAQRIREDYIAKARDLPHVVDNPEAVADTLQEIAAHSPSAADRIEKILEVAEQRLANSGLFSEAGHVGGGRANGAFERATAIAKSLVEQGQASDIESARATVWETNPDLFDEYQRERVAGATGL